MQKILLFVLVTAVAAAGIACQNQVSQTNDTPTEGYKRLYAAVKAKDSEAIKKAMTAKTLSFAESVAARQNNPLEKVLENGFTATTFSETLPEIRDERVSDNMGAVEVRNSKDNRWEDLPFIKEDGQWKLAVGELFAGTFKSPGPGRAQKEAEAANAAGNSMIEVKPAGNANVMGNVPPDFKSGPRPAANTNQTK